LTQLEVRYALGHFSPYAFYDVGALRINAKPDALMTVPTINKRSISGAGFGLAAEWRSRGCQYSSESPGMGDSFL
jgi:hemolysin activation/secretion protein